MNLIGANWGDEEGELRQAIYFQFIKRDVFVTSLGDMFFDEQERMLDNRESFLSIDGGFRESVGGKKHSVAVELPLNDRLTVSDPALLLKPTRGASMADA